MLLHRLRSNNGRREGSLRLEVDPCCWCLKKTTSYPREDVLESVVPEQSSVRTKNSYRRRGSGNDSTLILSSTQIESEQAVVSVKAAVMYYDNETKQWVHGGSLGQGLSKVQIYHHPVNRTYRIVGRSVDNPHEVVINCNILRNLKYNKATPMFHQWRDQRRVYGLNFVSSMDADTFAEQIASALDFLQSGSTGGSNERLGSLTHNDSYGEVRVGGTQHRVDSTGNNAPAVSMPTHYDVPTKLHDPTRTTLDRVSTRHSPQPGQSLSHNNQPVVTMNSPRMPPQQQHVSSVPTPLKPPAPSAPVSSAAPPAPPPPPPPPGSVGAAGNSTPPRSNPPPAPPLPAAKSSGGLLEQLQTAKLNRVAKEERSQSLGGVIENNSQDQMMQEMQRKLALRKAKAEGDSGKDDLTTTTDSTQGSSLSSSDFERIKQEILADVRTELDRVKEEIISAVRAELQSLRQNRV